MPDLAPDQVLKRIKALEAAMYKHARNLEFEEAARLRDEIAELRQAGLGFNRFVVRMSAQRRNADLAGACLVSRGGH